MHKAVFFDKDGTINEDPGYLKHYQDLKLLPHAAAAIKLLNEAGFKVIVASNQSGVARGMLSEDMLQAINKTLQKKILSKGAHIDDIYYCPHHAEHGVYPYRTECDCRKPAPGLIKKAVKKYGIDLAKSFMVGDTLADIETGKKANLKTILVLTGKGKETEKNLVNDHKPDHTAEDIMGAVKWILKN